MLMRTMRKLTVFNNVTLDGYFSGKNGDISWAKAHEDPEFQEFTEESAKSGGMIVLGRKTYDLMASYWPTQQAKEQDPVVAERMNSLPKVVFSRTMDEADWSNTRVMKGDLPSAIRKLKKESSQDLIILGSGSLVSQLAAEDLIDEYQVVVNPVVLGEGRTMFDGVEEPVNLKLTESRAFGQGNVLLRYEPEV